MEDREKIEAFADYEPYAHDLPCVTIKSKVYLDALELLKEQPEIVRCKDCKHRPVLDGKYPGCCNNGYDLKFPDSICPCRCEDDEYYSWRPSDYWFCPSGERANT